MKGFFSYTPKVLVVTPYHLEIFCKERVKNAFHSHVYIKNKKRKKNERFSTRITTTTFTRILNANSSGFALFLVYLILRHSNSEDHN